MQISKIFGGNRDEARPISSNRHKKIRYIYQDLEARLGKDTADRILQTSDRKYLNFHRVTEYSLNDRKFTEYSLKIRFRC